MTIKFSARGISPAFRTPQELVEQDAVTLKPTVGGEVIVSGEGDSITLASDYTEEGGCTSGVSGSDDVNGAFADIVLPNQTYYDDVRFDCTTYFAQTTLKSSGSLILHFEWFDDSLPDLTGLIKVGSGQTQDIFKIHFATEFSPDGKRSYYGYTVNDRTDWYISLYEYNAGTHKLDIYQTNSVSYFGTLSLRYIDGSMFENLKTYELINISDGVISKYSNPTGEYEYSRAGAYYGTTTNVFVHALYNKKTYPNTKTLNDAGYSVISDVFGAYDCDAEEGLNVKMVERWAKPTFIPEFTIIQYGHGKISTVEANVPYEVFKSPTTTPTAFTPDPNVAYINVSIMGNQYKFNAHTYQKDGKLWIVFETGYPIPAPYARTITFALFPKGAKEKIIMKSDNTMLCHGAYYDGCYAMMTNGAATGFSWNTEEELAAKGYHAVDPIPIPEEV